MSRAEQLRADIDRGRTGDKIPYGDPAGAPLGADDEAAGDAPSADAVKQARHAERATAPAQPPAAMARPDKIGRTWLHAVAFLVLLAVLVAGFVLVSG